MKIVQEALADVIASGVPVMEGIWRTEDENQNPPPQYVVYSTTITERQYWDDRPRAYSTTVYLDFWSKVDPTETRDLIRRCMYDAGFSIESESSKGYNQPAYDHYTHQYCIQWLWKIETEEMP